MAAHQWKYSSNGREAVCKRCGLQRRLRAAFSVKDRAHSFVVHWRWPGKRWRREEVDDYHPPTCEGWTRTQRQGRLALDGHD